MISLHIARFKNILPIIAETAPGKTSMIDYGIVCDKRQEKGCNRLLVELYAAFLAFVFLMRSKLSRSGCCSASVI
jgi:hypothetical protein